MLSLDPSVEGIDQMVEEAGLRDRGSEASRR